MKGTVRSRIDYVFEAIEFLYRYVNNDSYPDLKKKLMYKYTLNDKMEEKLSCIVDISEYIYSNMNLNKEKLDFYFHSINDEFICFAKLILLTHTTVSKHTLEEKLELLRSYNQFEIYNHMLGLLAENGSFSEEWDRNSKEITDYLSIIEKAGIEIADKWNLLKVFLNYNSYLTELEEMLRVVITLIKDKEDVMKEIISEFTSYWTDFIENNDLYNYIESSLNLNISNIAKEVIIIPTIAGCNGISCTMPVNELGKINDTYLYMHKGVLFGDSISIKLQKLDKNQVTSLLKLLSDKSKMDILIYIKDKKAYGQELASHFNLTTATISHHMSTLHAAGLVNLERDTNRIYYSLNKEKLNRFLDNVKQLLT